MRATGRYNGGILRANGYVEDGISYSADNPDEFAGLPVIFIVSEKSKYLAGLPEGATVYAWPESDK